MILLSIDICLSGITNVKVVALTAESETRRSRTKAERAARKQQQRETVGRLLGNPLLVLTALLGAFALVAAVVAVNILQQPSNPVVLGLGAAAVVFCGYVVFVLTRKDQRSDHQPTSK
jgi:hypothetical protein